MQALYGLAAKVARADIAVLVSGESGTGKEVMARYLHNASDRSSGPFVALNCAAVPETMLEAMLFGHEKGAFTGAQERRPGKFEQAQGGTLLLDEITEMAASLQAKLLRVLQERELERLGGSRVIPVDVRVIATSNRKLEEAVQDGLLREDLYYRLSVFPLRLPPLREHVEDVALLAAHFLEKHKPGRNHQLTPCALDILSSHAWPGNVRELENCIQRALVLAEDDVITADHLVLNELHVDMRVSTSSRLQERLRDEETDLLLETLDKNQGKRNVTAQQLGISERTLRYKLSALRARGIAC